MTRASNDIVNNQNALVSKMHRIGTIVGGEGLEYTPRTRDIPSAYPTWLAESDRDRYPTEARGT